MIYRVLILSAFYISFLAAHPLHADTDALRSKILKANPPWCDLWQLSKQIEQWTELQIQDTEVTKKLLKIITWSRNPILNGQNIHLRRVKRAATNALLLTTPNDTTLIKISRSLDKAFEQKAHIYLDTLDTTDYVFVAELLAAWAHNENEVALEELTRAIESDEPIKVLEAEFALANIHSIDPTWLETHPDHLARLKRALGRPWVYSYLQSAYQRDLRLKHHAEGQLAFALRSTLNIPITAQDIENKFNSGMNDGSLFNFFQTLEQLHENSTHIENREDSIVKIDEAIQKILNLNPQLKFDSYFAWTLLKSIETFSLHSPFIDRLLADWLEIPFKLNPSIASMDAYTEKNLIKGLRKAALEQLVKIQQRFHYAQTVERVSHLSQEERDRIGFLYFPVIAINPTAVDELALKKALECQNCSAHKKLELIDIHLLDQAYIQNALISFARDPRAQSKALELLNYAPSLTPRQIDALGATIGISNPEEAALYLPYYTNLRKHFSTVRVSSTIVGKARRCLYHLKVHLFGQK